MLVCEVMPSQSAHLSLYGVRRAGCPLSIWCADGVVSVPTKSFLLKLESRTLVEWSLSR